MTDIPEAPPQRDPDTVVEQAVERAATKVAAAATTNGHGNPMLNKMESIIAVALILTIGFMNLAMNIVTAHQLGGHKSDFKAMCQVFVEFAPPEKAIELARQLAECLN